MATAGTTVGGRYQLIRVIGAGGMSTVWLAMDETLGKQWAVKEIRLSDDPAEREIITSSLVAEANLIKRFDHVAIPRIVDLVDEGGTLYVVMDYVEGRSLESLSHPRAPRPRRMSSTGRSSSATCSTTYTSSIPQSSTAT